MLIIRNYYSKYIEIVNFLCYNMDIFKTYINNTVLVL